MMMINDVRLATRILMNKSTRYAGIGRGTVVVSQSILPIEHTTNNYHIDRPLHYNIRGR